MDIEEIKKLFTDKSFDKLSPDEQAKIDHWYLNEAASKKYSENENLRSVKHQIWSKVSKNTGIISTKRKFSQGYKIAAACCLFILVGTLVFVKIQKSDSIATKNPIIINPGGDKATLILANGKKIILDNIANGSIAIESGIDIHKTKNGLIEYHFTAERKNILPPSINKIETPHGGQYQIILPDGSKVWLNSSSTISFPTNFTGNTRSVEITGEVYFEIATNKQMPFKVYTARANNTKQEVEVLGTHFNINSYSDEPYVKTTLVEGSIKLSTIQNNKVISSNLIKPGQQALVEDHNITLKNVNADDFVAWKDGVFVFNNEKITDVIKKLSRWYNIEINYEGSLDDIYLHGSIPRNITFDQAIKLLELTGNFKFKMNGRRITLMR